MRLDLLLPVTWDKNVVICNGRLRQSADFSEIDSPLVSIWNLIFYSEKGMQRGLLQRFMVVNWSDIAKLTRGCSERANDGSGDEGLGGPMGARVGCRLERIESKQRPGKQENICKGTLQATRIL